MRNPADHGGERWEGEVSVDGASGVVCATRPRTSVTMQRQRSLRPPMTVSHRVPFDQHHRASAPRRARRRRYRST